MHDLTNMAGDKMSEDIVALADDPDANREIAAMAIERAMKRGASLDLATRLYGFVDLPRSKRETSGSRTVK